MRFGEWVVLLLLWNGKHSVNDNFNVDEQGKEWLVLFSNTFDYSIFVNYK